MRHFSFFWVWATAIAFLLAGVGSGSATAQDGALYWDLGTAPQSMIYRPTQSVIGTAHVGVPGLSLIGFNGSQSLIDPNALLMNGGAGALQLNMASLVSSLAGSPELGFNLHVELLSGGLQTKHGYWGISVTEHVDLAVTLPGAWLSLPFIGNAPSDNGAARVIDGSDLSLDAMHYRSYALAYQRKFDFISVGARLKYLYGMEHASLKTSALNWTTDPDTWAWNFEAAGSLQTAGVSPLLDGSGIGDAAAYASGKANHGWGLDLGFECRPNDRLNLVAQATGLGSMSWESDVQHYELDTVSWTWEGLVLQDVDWNSWDPADSLVQWVSAQTATIDSLSAIEPLATARYRTKLAGRYTLGLSYDLLDLERLSGRVHAAMHWGRNAGWQVGYTLSGARGHGVSLTYSERNGSGSALGVASTLALGPIQLLIGIDNLLVTSLAAVEMPDESTTYIPLNANRFGAHIGVQWIIGRNVKRTVSTAPVHSGSVPCENHGRARRVRS
jgi:hypothetical protein